MSQRELFDALTELAHRMSIPVRAEALDKKRSSGGLVKLKGRWVILVDRDVSLPDQIAVLATALGRFDWRSAAVSAEVKRTLQAMSRKLPRNRRDNTLPLELGPEGTRLHRPGIRYTRRGQQGP